METRSTRSRLHLHHPFVLPGSDAPLPAGEYVLIEEEERMQGLTFDAYRRTGTFLVVDGGPDAPGRTELRQMTGDDLTHLIARDAALVAGLIPARSGAASGPGAAEPGETESDRPPEDHA